jgi:hypothetical protein
VPMREHIDQHGLRRARGALTCPRNHAPETIGHRLLERSSSSTNGCHIGGSLRLDDLADSEIGDWTRLNYRAACRYAASRVGGWSGTIR